MKNILLIEPNTVLARLYSELLVQNGYEVTHVYGAQDGIEAADERTPNLVILELQLPGHSGVEFLHEFRSYIDWLRVPVIVHTMIPRKKLDEVAEPLREQLGVGVILYKPQTSLAALLQKVREQFLLV